MPAKAPHRRGPPHRGDRPRGPAARLGPHAARLEGRLQLPRTQRRLLAGQHPGHRPGRAGELRVGRQAAHGRVAASPSRPGQGVARQGPGHRGRGPPRSPSTALADAETYPLQKKRHSFEFLRTIAHLRPRTNTFGAVARVRNCVCRSIHEFFQEEGFLYIHTPIITASDCEGAGEMFQVTTLDLANPPKTRHRRSTSRRTSSTGPAYLTVSGQLEAEIFACALGKVYTFGPTFRAENSNTLAPPGRVLDGRARDGLLRPRRQHGPGRAVPEADLPRRARPLPRGHGVLQPADRQDGDRDAASTSSTADFVRLPYTEAVEILEKPRARRSSFPSPGATTCRPSTSAT